MIKNLGIAVAITVIMLWAFSALMNSAIAESNWKEAAKEGRDSRWYRQVTNRAERLMSRLENVKKEWRNFFP